MRIFTGLLVSLIILESQLFGQIEPRAILDKVQEKYDAIEDYKVKINLKVDIPNFRMPNKNMQVYYKKPDKVKVETSGFAVLPRFGLVPTPAIFLNDSARATYLRSFREGSTLYHVIAISRAQFDQNRADVFLRINANRWTIDRATIEDRQEGTTEVNITYKNIDGFWLPDTTRIEFNLKRSIPPVERPNVNQPFGGKERYTAEDDQPVKGYMTIIFSKFIVNRGIKEWIFKEE